jgi:16S rRNA processing protein RimM
MPDHNTTEWAAIGKIVAFFGIHGELKVFSLSDVPDRFAQLESVYLRPGYARYAIERVRPYKGNMLVLKLSGIDDANAAEALRDHELCIPLDQLAGLPPDSYYQHDIIGLHVTTLEGQTVGTITDILVTGGNDVYVIKTASGREALIPAIKDVVKQVDLLRRSMYIDPMPGLLDDDAVIVGPDSRDDGEEE